jgi:hypothetical protein
MRTLLGVRIATICAGFYLCILANNLYTFFPSPETLCENELKGDGLINLAEVISMQPSIQAMA